MTSNDQSDTPHDYKELDLPYSLSVEDTVKYMIFGNPNIGMSRAWAIEFYDEPFLMALEVESKHFEQTYRSSLGDSYLKPVMLRANLENLEKIVDRGLDYKNGLVNEIELAKRSRSKYLVIDRLATETSGLDMVTTESASEWATHTFDLDVGLFYLVTYGQPRQENYRSLRRAKLITKAITTPSCVNSGQKNPQAISNTTRRSHDISQANVTVTSFLVATALADQLERLRYDNPAEFGGFESFKRNGNEVNTSSMAQYLVRINPGRNVDRDGFLDRPFETEESASTNETLILFLLANCLAKVLQKALDNDDFIAWQKEETQKPEQYLFVSGHYNCAALQRFITAHVLKGVSLPNQKATAVQKRLKAAEKKATQQVVHRFSHEDICDYLSSAQMQYKRVLKSMKH